MYRVPAGGGQAWRVMECMGAHLAPSPDGKQLAFTRGWSPFARTGYRGSANHDVWIRDVTSGNFTQLTTFDGTDIYPKWNADSAGVYFLSDRPGTGPTGKSPDPRGTHNVWYQPLGGGVARQLTFETTDRVRDFSVSGDGKTLAYTVWDKVFAGPLNLAAQDGGAVSAREITIDAGDDLTRKPVDWKSFTKDADEMEVSPDGKEVALVVHGEVFVIRTEPEKPTRRVTNSHARDRQVTWTPDGKALYFVSDADGRESIYRALSGESPHKPLSESLRFTVERVTEHLQREQFPSVSPDGRSLAFVRDRGMLVLRDLQSGVERVLLDGWDTPSVRWSPDSKWLAYQVEDAEFNSDIWIVPADGSAKAVNISQHPDNDLNPQWSADGQVLAFASKRGGFDFDLYMVFLSPQLHEKSTVDLNSYFEAAGKKAKKHKPLKECVASGDITRVGHAASQPASASAPAIQFSNGSAAKGKGKVREPRPGDPDTPDLTPKQKARAGIRESPQEPSSRPKKEEKKEDDDDDEKEEDKKDDKKDEKEEKYAYGLPSAYRRLRLVTSLPADQSSFALSPDGAMLAFASSHEGTPGVHQVKWNGEDRKRILSSAAGSLQWTQDGAKLFYLKTGVPGSCKEGGGEAKDHGYSAKMMIDFAAEAAQKFDDGARTFGQTFYHPTMKDLDWPALSNKYRELALKVHTTQEFNEVFDLLMGEVNGSHLGISGPPSGIPNETVGYLGCEFDPAFAGSGLMVSSIVKDSPADRAESLVFVGDVFLRVNGMPVGPDSPIERALLNTVGDQIIIEYLPSEKRAAESQPASTSAPATSQAADEQVGLAAATKSPKRELVIRPIAYGAFNQLCYQAWVDANAKYVDEKSGGRVAYTHIAGMGESQFHVFERDLYAVAHGKDGLIIDVRNNGGGWTADWVMAVLNVKRHAYTVPRGGTPGYPQDRLIFYAWPKPATMMCNQYSYSNAEIVSHAFKNLKRGPLVGVQTFGAVISTGAFSLIDGTTIRRPFRGWYTIPDGKDMELNGALPDVPMPQTPDDEQNGRRPQLDAAIRATLDQLK
jgi:tricorn protease